MREIDIVVRRIDDLGRVAIPSKMRNALKIKKGDIINVHMNTEEKYIIISLHEDVKQEKPNFEEMWNELKKNKTISKDVFEEIEQSYK